MIPYNFDYYKPDSIAEAVIKFMELQSIGKKPLYYNGGMEIITFARVNSIYTGGVVDIEGIPECNVFEMNREYLVIGSAVTLSEIADSYMYSEISLGLREQNQAVKMATVDLYNTI